jgi:hypothetical protein
LKPFSPGANRLERRKAGGDVELRPHRRSRAETLIALAAEVYAT